MEEQNNKLKITVFSTDHQLITAMPIFNVYLENFSNPSYINTFNNHFTFHFDFENTEYLALIFPIDELDKKKDICSFADSSIIIVSLESDQSKDSFEKIIKYIAANCQISKQIYVLGVAEKK